MSIKSFSDLEVWQLAMDLVVDVYRLTTRFPTHELYGLSAQMRRAAISTPSNVAEGSRQGTTGSLIQYLRHALGSNAELETQLKIARRLGYGADDAVRAAEELTVRVAMMLNKLTANLERSRRS
jgi:four helix bundle protein